MPFSPTQRQRGALIVEYALLMPIVMLTLLLFLEVTRIHLVTILLDRALYNIAYELRITRGGNLPSIARNVLNKGNYHLFSPANVEVTALSGSGIGAIARREIPNQGLPGQPVLLRLRTDIGILDALAGVFNAVDTDERQYNVELTLLSLNEPE